MFYLEDMKAALGLDKEGHVAQWMGTCFGSRSSCSCSIEPPSQSAATKPARHPFSFFFFFPLLQISKWTSSAPVSTPLIGSKWESFGGGEAQTWPEQGGASRARCLRTSSSLGAPSHSVCFNPTVKETFCPPVSENKKQFLRGAEEALQCEAGWMGSGGRFDVKQRGLVVSTWPVGRATVLLSK